MSARRMWPTPNAMDGERPMETPTQWRAREAQKKAANPKLGGLHRPLTIAILEDDRGPTASNQLTLFAEAFPVSPIVSPAAAAPPPTTATSGRSSPALFASVNPDGSWRKTYPDCSPVRLDGSSVPFSETWPRAGMTRSGRAYQLAPLVRLTDATECGSWPTPRSYSHGEDSNQPGLTTLDIRVRGMYRDDPKHARYWPTPCAEDAKNVPYQKGDGGKRYPMLLGAVAPERMWPTPSANQQSGGVTGLNGGSGARAKLESLVGREDMLLMARGSLNPTWVEWLMGYPLGWTACAAWATRSSRKSRSGLPAASSSPKG